MKTKKRKTKKGGREKKETTAPNHNERSSDECERWELKALSPFINLHELPPSPLSIPPHL